MYPNRYFSIKWTYESNFIFRRTQEEFRELENYFEKIFGLACSLKYCPGKNPVDINIDVNNSFWSYEIGEGHSRLETFFGIMYKHAPSSEYKKI